MAYVITEDDYIIEERPEVKFVGYEGDKRTFADIEEMPECLIPDTEYVYTPLNLTIHFEHCKSSYKFTIDTDFQFKNVTTENIRSYRVFVNDIETILDENFKVRENDVIQIKNVIKYNSFKDSKIKIEGFNYSEVEKIDESINIIDIIHS